MNISSTKFIELVQQSQSNMRAVWDINTKHALNEQAIPSYLHPNMLVSKIFWKRIQIIINELNKNKPESVLDFGCGVGTLFLFLQALGISHIIAFDPKPQAIRSARHIISVNNIHNIELLSQLQELNRIPNKSIDVITALDVLEHVDNLQAIMKNFKRILKPTGTIYISGPTENLLYRSLRRLGGDHYKKNFHVRNIYDIENQLKQDFQVTTLANLWPVINFFRLIQAKNVKI